MNKEEVIWEVSNPDIVKKKLKKLYPEVREFGLSKVKYKKYYIRNPDNNKIVNFGDIRYEDFTKHQDKERRLRYLNRATNMKGNWKDNKYSANNLSINLLW